MATALYSLFIKSLFNKEVDLDSDSLKGLLMTSSYTPSMDTHQYKSDLTNEVTGTGYTATGQALTSVVVSYIAANSWATARANSTAYTVGQVVRPASGNGFLYQASVAGTSAGSLPTYPTVVGTTVTDGSVTWTCIGHGAVRMDADDLAWATSTITARYCAVYDSTPASDATRPLISLVDFGSDKTSSAGLFTVAWDPTGVFFFIVP